MDNQPEANSKSSSLSARKLIFAPVFLILFAFFSYQLNAILNIQGLVFSLSLNSLIQSIILVAITLLTSLAFVVFSCLAFDIKLVAPINIVAVILLLIFLPSPLSYIAAVITFLVLCFIYFLVELKLKTYLDFRPSNLFSSAVKELAWMLIIVASISYFFVTYNDIRKNGFQVPDSLIEIAIKLSPAVSLDQPAQELDLPQIPDDQLKLLKESPQLLKQYGISVDMLDKVNKLKEQTKQENPVKQILSAQLQTALKPYQSFIAPLLAILFYFSLTFINSLLSIFIPALVYLIFKLLEETKFITFTTEQRTVKKMVV